MLMRKKKNLKKLQLLKKTVVLLNPDKTKLDQINSMN